MSVYSQQEFLYQEYKTRLGVNVRRRMDQLGLSIIQLGDRMDSGHAQVYRILEGQNNVHLTTLCKLVAALELDGIGDLFVDPASNE